MSKTQGVGCQHLIADVALLKVSSGYLVECHGCASALGVVATPREFQVLRRGVLALDVRGEVRRTPYKNSFSQAEDQRVGGEQQ